jgi:hypothetical protein
VIKLLVRGALRATAAISGLLLVYGIKYTMEGETIRLPLNTTRELATSTLSMLPWMLLFCSGFDDFATLAKRQWVFWSGSFLLLLFVYYYDRNTSGLTKAVMPSLACIGAVIPHVFRRVLLPYTICSVLAGTWGIVVLYFAFQTFLSPKTSFANGAISFVLVTFALTSLGAGVLSVTSPSTFPAAQVHSC